MSILVHLSDTHFGTEVPHVVRAVQQALVDIKPDIVTITGDLTQRARPSQFHATAEFLESLPADLKFVIPGNHDIPLFNLPVRLLNPYRDYSRAFGLRGGVWCHDKIGIIGLDATSRWRHTRGKMDETTLLRFVGEARAQLQPDALLVVCAHQPLVTAWPEDHENILIHAERTAQILAENGVDLVLSGYVHVPLIATTQAAYPSLPRHFVLSGAGTAVSYRIRPRAPNSFNVIELQNGEPSSIAITLMEYQTDSEAFVQASRTVFTKLHGSWQSGT